MGFRDDGSLERGNWEEIPTVEPLSTYAQARKCLSTVLRPSFTNDFGGRAKILRRTAYLDGIRGFAALLVYCGHHQLWAHDSMSPEDIFENAFGYDNRYFLACLPGIRTFFSGGHFAVAIFFVLSGYVLSAKPLTLIHAGDYYRLSENLASGLFRRWLRLHIPLIVTTFLYMSSWHVFGISGDSERQSTYGAEVWKWYAEFKNFSFVFRTGGEPWLTYNYHVWSIPVEFRGSIVVYTSLLAFSRLRKNVRLWCQVGLIIYFMWIVDGWFCAMFVAGMLLCDLDLLAADNELPKFFSSLERFQTIIFSILFIVGIYLGGVPAKSRDIQVLRNSPGWYYLSYLKPQAIYDFKWFYLFWAAMFVVPSIHRLRWLKSFFESRFNLYLGRISYSFYLVHGPILSTIGDRVYAAVGWTKESHTMTLPAWINLFPLPKSGPLGMEISFLTPNLILFPLTLWVAEIATNLIDEPTVKFSQWLYLKTLEQPSEKF